MDKLSNITAKSILAGLTRGCLDTLKDILLGDIYVVYDHTGSITLQPNVLQIFCATNDDEICTFLYSADFCGNLYARFYELYSPEVKAEIDELDSICEDWEITCLSLSAFKDPYVYFCNNGEFLPETAREVIERVREILVYEMEKIGRHVMSLREFLDRDWTARV